MSNIVPVVKNWTKWNLHFSFLYSIQVFEWWCIWYVLASSNNIGSLTESGRSDLTILSTHFAYPSMLNFVSLGAFKIQIKECICGLPLTWNSTRIASYWVFPSGPSRTINLKKKSLLYIENVLQLRLDFCSKCHIFHDKTVYLYLHLLYLYHLV